MNSVDLSIIVPVYNMEKYINECLDSLINQKLNKYKYEIICVDDGSVDSSIDILKEYSKTYSDIVKVITIENSGVSNARNIGVKNAIGKYVTFVDSDDWVGENFVYEAIYNISKDSIDLVIFDTNYVYNEIHLHKESISGTIFNTENHACGKVFKREILLKNNIIFPIDLSIGEDMVFTFQYISIIEIYKHVKMPLYNYRRTRQDSAMNSNINNKYKEVFNACRYIYEFNLNNNILEKNKEGLEYLFIKNLIVRNLPKNIKSNLKKGNIIGINKEINEQYSEIVDIFPLWKTNRLILDDVDNYFKNKLGSNYIKVLECYPNKLFNLIIFFVLGKLKRRKI